MKSIDHKSLLENNAVHSHVDVLHLVRGLVNVPRGHCLPMTHRESILEHCAKCVQLIDFLHTNNYITPALTDEEHSALRDYMFYHDMHEVLVGDIPYHVEKCFGDEPSKVRNILMRSFGKNLELSPELFQLAKIVDCLEFLITIGEDPKLQLDTFEGKRLRQVKNNAALIVETYLGKTLKYTVNYRKIFSLLEMDDLLNS